MTKALPKPIFHIETESMLRAKQYLSKDPNAVAPFRWPKAGQMCKQVCMEASRLLNHGIGRIGRVAGWRHLCPLLPWITKI